MGIRVLSPLVANQIAAGEVVERPAAAVKELMENSLDAGASSILVDILAGGLKRITVRDDGRGIPREELGLALRRHATSKLSEISDLDTLTSMGFRGEALASVAAVSRLTLTSKPRGQETAFAAETEGAEQEPAIAPAAHPDGTTVEVLDIFFNTPARRRFLKSEKTEFAQIEEIFKRIAVSRPDVSFELRHNGKVVHDLRAGDGELRRLEKVFGRAAAGELLKVERSEPGLALRGYVAAKAGSRPAQYFFVNGRAVRDRVVIHAIREAYELTSGAKGEVPYVFFLEMPRPDVDVNVHPQKAEVRFREPRRVHDFIQTAVMNALGNASALIPETMEETARPRQSHRYGGGPAGLFGNGGPDASAETAPRREFPGAAAPGYRGMFGYSQPPFAGGAFPRGRAGWSPEAMEKMFGAEAEPPAPGGGDRGDAVPAGEPAFAACGFAPCWLRPPAGDRPLFRVALLADGGRTAVVYGRDKLLVVRLRALARRLFLDEAEARMDALTRTAELLAPFEFREEGLDPGKTAVLSGLGFAVSRRGDVLTVAGVPALIRGMNIAGAVRRLLARVTGDSGTREAFALLAGDVFEQTVPGSFSREMAERLAGAVAEEGFFAEKLPGDSAEIDLAPYLDGLGQNER